MTTESSVLEKLKLYRELQKLELWDSEDDDKIDEWNDIAWWYDYELTPCLIAALELLEQKAAKKACRVYLESLEVSETYCCETMFAREVLALLKGEGAK